MFLSLSAFPVQFLGSTIISRCGKRGISDSSSYGCNNRFGKCRSISSWAGCSFFELCNQE